MSKLQPYRRTPCRLVPLEWISRPCLPRLFPQLPARGCLATDESDRQRRGPFFRDSRVFDRTLRALSDLTFGAWGTKRFMIQVGSGQRPSRCKDGVREAAPWNMGEEDSLVGSSEVGSQELGCDKGKSTHAHHTDTCMYVYMFMPIQREGERERERERRRTCYATQRGFPCLSKRLLTLPVYFRLSA